MNSNLIDQFVNQCRHYSGSYPVYQHLPYRTEQIINTIYQTLARETSNLEIKTTNYPESNGTKNIVYIGVCLSITYKNNNYSVYGKVTFPPNFHLVPPILSVLNINEKQFQINKRYFDFILPDKTYEVKLQAASQWKYSFDFSSLLHEFKTTLGSNFPFFKVKVPQVNHNQTVVYDPRYNMPGVDFPFDYDLSVSQNKTQNTSHNTTFTQRDEPLNYENYTNPTQLQRKPSNSGNAIKTTLGDIQNIIESDLNTYEGNLQTLIEKKEKLETKLQLVQHGEGKLKYNMEIVNQQYQILQNEYNDQKDKTLNKNMLINFLDNSPEEMKLIKSYADVRGVIEAQNVIEELYFDDNCGEFDEVLGKLEELWKKEYDHKLQYKYWAGQLA